MKKAFNLKRFVRTAFYDDNRGDMQGQTRCMQNCYKRKADKNMSPQEAWEECLKEYNSTKDKEKWILSYSGASDEADKPRSDSKTPFVKK